MEQAWEFCASNQNLDKTQYLQVYFLWKLKLTHSVRTRQVELQSIRTSLSCHLGQRLPVVLVVAAHDAGDHNVRGEVLLDLGDASENQNIVSCNLNHSFYFWNCMEIMFNRLLLEKKFIGNKTETVMYYKLLYFLVIVWFLCNTISEIDQIIV